MVESAIKKYIEEVKNIDINSTEAQMLISEYHGIYRVLADIVTKFPEYRELIDEFSTEYKKVSDAHLNLVVNRLKKDADVCNKIRANIEKESVDLRESDNSVTQVFNDRAIPKLNELAKLDNIDEADRLDRAKDIVMECLNNANCSDAYYSKKRVAILQKRTFDSLMNLVYSTVNNGSKYISKE